MCEFPPSSFHKLKLIDNVKVDQKFNNKTATEKFIQNLIDSNKLKQEETPKIQGTILIKQNNNINITTTKYVSKYEAAALQRQKNMMLAEQNTINEPPKLNKYEKHKLEIIKKNKLSVPLIKSLTT